MPDHTMAELHDPQARYDLVLAHYLSGSISLVRAAELLGVSWFDLRTRFLRLDVPLRAAPANLEEAEADVDAADTWSMSSQL
ncbi:MAG: UPF0175 family protein [Anaerolineae bacterium]|nr:UPF0175 family protein [Anaerolineae bacterium]